METAAAMVFCLPRNLGGYGFGGAELNKRVYLSGQARRIWGKGCLYLDICWRESRLGLEYNSADFHTNVVQDESRRLALGRDGWRLQFAASQQLWQAAQRDEVARRIGSVLRVRTRRPTRRTLRAREYLIAELKPQKETDSDTWRKPRWAFADVG